MAKELASKAAEKTTTPQATWPDFAAGLYDKLTGRGAEITYEFDDFNVFIPAKFGEQTGHFHWRIEGSVTIKTHESAHDSSNNE